MSLTTSRARREGFMASATVLLLGACAGSRAEVPVTAAALGGIPYEAVFDARDDAVVVATSRGVVRIDADGSVAEPFGSFAPPAPPVGGARGPASPARPRPADRRISSDLSPIRRGPFALSADGRVVVEAPMDGREYDGVGIRAWRIPNVRLYPRKASFEVDFEGVREIAVGSGGKLILGSRPRDRTNPSLGAWEVGVFDDDGDRRDTISTPSRPRIALAPDGSAAVVAAREEMHIVRIGHTAPVVITGRFADPVLSDRGEVVIARRQDVAGELAIVGVPGCTSIRAPGPIHGARIAPGGETALLWLLDGMIHVVRLAACRYPAETLPLPARLAGLDVFVASADLRDDELVTAGLLVRPMGADRFQRGSVVQWRRGVVVRDVEIPVGLSSATVPQVTVGRGGRVAVRTFESVTVFPALP